MIAKVDRFPKTYNLARNVPCSIAEAESMNREYCESGRRAVSARAMRLAVVAAAAITPSLAIAADPDNLPGRGVARISVIQGDVSLRRGDSGDHVSAALNAPLVVSDRLFTGAGSRAEVQFDWANMIRLSSNSEIRFSELEYRRYQVQIARGTVTFRVLREIDAEVELSTPSVSVRPVKKGIYRITVQEDGTSEITVRDGEAEVFTPRGSERLREGRTMLARGTASDPEYQIVHEIAQDDWDRWNEYRDRDLARSRSYTYVSRDIYGAEDLDYQGRWIYVSPYGYVWSPHVVGGWAPYRFGRWTWIDWYGWSWVSHDPWGWAPYHYGRWFHAPLYGWCWWPGGLHARHYWRPALVAFFGFGNAGIGFGFGRVGWVPLAPYEPYYAWYGHRWYGGYRNRAYIDNSVNIVNNINITNVYRNARVSNAVTAVDAGGFGRGGRQFVRVENNEFTRARLVKGQLPLAPERESLRFGDREVTPPARIANEDRRFYSRREPARVERVPFEEQRRAMAEVSRRTFGEAPSRAGLAAAAGGTDRAAAALPRAADDSRQGWRRVDESPRTGGTPRSRVSSEPARGASGPGWRRDTRPVTPGEGADAWRRFGNPFPGRGEESRSEPARFDSRSETDRGRFAGRVEGGEPRGGSPSRVETARPAAGDNPRSEDGWRRFERSESPRFERRSESPRVEASPESPRFERRSETPRSESPRFEGRNESQRSEGGREWQRFEQRSEPPRFERRNEGGFGGGESIRINPPIVRERGGDAPRFERAPDSPRRSSGSMPRFESPRVEGGGRRDFGGGGSPRFESGVGSPRFEGRPQFGGSSPRFEGGGGSPTVGGGSPRSEGGGGSPRFGGGAGGRFEGGARNGGREGRGR